MFAVLQAAEVHWPICLNEGPPDAILGIAQELKGFGEDALDLLHALFIRESRLETKERNVESAEQRIGRGIATEDGRAACQIVEQTNLPVE